MAMLALLVTLALSASNYIVFDDFENKSKAFNFLWLLLHSIYTDHLTVVGDPVYTETLMTVLAGLMRCCLFATSAEHVLLVDVFEDQFSNIVLGAWVIVAADIANGCTWLRIEHLRCLMHIIVHPFDLIRGGSIRESDSHSCDLLQGIGPSLELHRLEANVWKLVEKLLGRPFESDHVLRDLSAPER